jgi:hypothetical protein
MTGALAPFSYQVVKYLLTLLNIINFSPCHEKWTTDEQIASRTQMKVHRI